MVVVVASVAVASVAEEVAPSCQLDEVVVAATSHQVVPAAKK
jgi:hypothetical protein